MSQVVSERAAPGGFAIKSDWLPLLALTATWLAAILVVDPRGNFPLLDDWSYGRSVKELVEQGRLAYDGWNTPTLTFQVLYGALFCLPFGFSFESLRAATLVAALAGGLATYALLREGGAGKRVATFGCLAVFVNPGYFQHAFTFMTDVPFTALAVLAAVLFVRSMRTGSWRHVVYGTIVAACATLVRQPGIAIPFAYGLALIVANGLVRRTLLRAVLPFAFVLGVLLLHGRVLDYLHMTPALADSFVISIGARLQAQGAVAMLRYVVNLNEALFAHAAMFVLPCILLLLPLALPRDRQATLARPLMFGVAALLLVLLYWRFWPAALPVRVFGMAHSTMHGPQPWTQQSEPLLFRRALLSIEAVATLLLLWQLAVAVMRLWVQRAALHRERGALGVFALSAGFLLLLPFELAGEFNERYIIPAVPFAILVLVSLSGVREGSADPGGIRVVAGGIVLLAYALVSLAFAHDYLRANAARWAAIDFLVRDKGIEPARIDGGLSVNGWYLFPTEGALRSRYIHWRSQPPGWWRNEDAEFTIGFGADPSPSSSMKASPADDWKIILRNRYNAWLPGTADSVVVCAGANCGRYFQH